MELLLNLFWLLLVVPTCYCWARRRYHTKALSLVTFACLLALLFPVISASDDLHVMRQEMEEHSRRTLKQAVVTEDSAHDRFSAPPVQLTHAFAVPTSYHCQGYVIAIHVHTPSTVTPKLPVGRAPPANLLA